ncbi:hypothetical protein DH2020_003155 [Rehmannia glutinosa]|uniref:RNA polymerase II subunit B1 CTD phosphatase RPAP2 homolog n=1 Tax=Rehmannia glutinosa TaxID=99300 RepID=A0ABR0XL03_REHGL
MIGPGNSKKMTKDEVLTVKDAVHKLQLSLLDGIKHENQLTAAGSLISRSDYQDVVTERTIANVCGYPLCGNSLSAERPWKGRYRISLKEHKVYDLQETYMYCSSSCLINSRAFAASLQEERSSTLNPAKLNEVLKLFDGLSLDSDVNMGKNGDLGLSGLKIQEKTDTVAGQVALEEWIGPSNAIDGYVPRRDRDLKHPQSNNNKGERREVGSKHRHVRPNAADILSYDMNFTSTIITQDEYSISKTVPAVKAKEPKGKASSKEVNRQSNPVQKPTAPLTNIQETRSKNKSKNVITKDDKLSLLENIAGPSQNDSTKAVKELQESRAGALKSSLKTSVLKKATRSVTWADEKTDGDGQNRNECRELKDKKGAVVTSHSADEEVGEESYRFASAEACAMALTQAAEEVASGKSEASDAGMKFLSGGCDNIATSSREDEEENGDVMETDPLQLKWPPKPGFSSDDLFDSEDSWKKVFMRNTCQSMGGVSTKDCYAGWPFLEIKQTLAGCLARALPGLVAELRLPIPVSTLEQGMGRLLDTMSFIDPLPAFRMKQWHAIVLLFLDALSVSRIPALTPYMMDRRILLPKVIEGAQISAEEFEIMKDLIIPLGRVPQFSTQSGG